MAILVLLAGVGSAVLARLSPGAIPSLPLLRSAEGLSQLGRQFETASHLDGD